MKKIFVLSLFCLGASIAAQNVGNSPYAAIGIGDIKYDNTVENSAMGGISTAYITDFGNTFNFRNPAANENLQLTSIKIETSNENNFFRSDFNNYKGKKSSTYLSNISIAFPLSQKTKFGLGYQPYSSKRYGILLQETLSDNTTIKANSLQGKGTINTAQAALSYQITPEFSLGGRANLYFGSLYEMDEVTRSDSELINGYETKTEVNSFNFTLGATYQKKYEDDTRLTIGATSTFGNTRGMKTTYTNSTYYYNTTTSEKEQESIIEQVVTKETNLIPAEASIGVGYGQFARWFVGSQVDYRKGGDISFHGRDYHYQDSYRIAAGGWYLPNANNFRSYLSRIIYRYGAFYERGNLNINDNSINKFGFDLGATLPFKNRTSGLDLGLEFGKRGTLDNNLVRQNFVNFKIGINFADKWFGKTYYD